MTTSKSSEVTKITDGNSQLEQMLSDHTINNFKSGNITDVIILI